MEFQIIDKELGPQIIPVINTMTIHADNADEAVAKVMRLMGVPKELADMMGIQAVATTKENDGK